MDDEAGARLRRMSRDGVNDDDPPLQPYRPPVDRSSECPSESREFLCGDPHLIDDDDNNWRIIGGDDDGKWAGIVTAINTLRAAAESESDDDDDDDDGIEGDCFEDLKAKIDRVEREMAIFREHDSRLTNEDSFSREQKETDIAARRRRQLQNLTGVPRICRSFAYNGYCPFGSRCRLSHPALTAPGRHSARDTLEGVLDPSGASGLSSRIITVGSMERSRPPHSAWTRPRGKDYVLWTDAGYPSNAWTSGSVYDEIYQAAMERSRDSRDIEAVLRSVGAPSRETFARFVATENANANAEEADFVARAAPAA